MDDRVNGGVEVQPGSVAGTSVPQPPLLEGPSVHPFEFSFKQLDADRQQIQSQKKSLQEQQKELVDGQKIMMAFFEKLLDICQREIVRDPMTTVPVVARGDDEMPIETEGVRPEDVIIVTRHPEVSQEVLSSASVTGTSRWRYLRISPEYQPQTLLEGRIGKNYEFSPDPPTRRPARLPAPPRHRKGGVEDRPADPRRIKVRRRVEDHPADPRRIEVTAPAGYLLRLDLTEDIFFDIMEERLYHRRGAQGKVHQPLGGEPLMARIRISQLPVGWVISAFSRFDGKGDPDQHLIEYRTLMAPNNSDDQLARMFKQSLKGQALVWYVRLRRNSINSFEALAREFSCQYACNRTQPKRIDTLFDLKMGLKESLKDFVTRFREKTSEVTEVDRNKGIICAAFKNALIEGHSMKVDLILKPIVHLYDLYERAQKRIRVEVDALRGKRTITVHVVVKVPAKEPAREERVVLQEFWKVNLPPFDRSKGKAVIFP